MRDSEMKGDVSRVVRYGVVLLGLVILGWVLTGQAARPSLEGLPTDWTHSHLIFSQPATVRQAARIAGDPRYWQQWYRREVVRGLPADAAALGEAASSDLQYWGISRRGLHQDWSENLGTNAAVGAGNFPAKYSFGITQANCASATTPDYVVFNTGLTGSATQASIVAFDNLYSGCTGTKPTVYWAYNTGGQILTSPAISLDGTQVAFVQTNVALNGTLVLLKWAASGGSPGLPAAITTVSNGSYRTCTAPCMTTIILRNSLGVATDDRTSSVFPNYDGDIIWVGSTSGWLHKITGAFLGTPAEVTTGGFPVQVNPGNPTTLSSPVYDFVSGRVFVGDLGGYIYRVAASSGAVTPSGQVDHGTGVVAGPIVDSTAGRVYVFASNDGSLTCAGGTAPCSAVYIFATNFASGSTGSEATVGTSSAAPNPLYDGTFDSAYRASSNATGNLYVCGNTGLNSTLYRLPVSGGSFSGTAIAIGTLTPAANHRVCSPVTDIPNPNATGGAAERLFFSVQLNARPTACAGGGCAMSFVDMPWKASTSYQVGQEILVLRTANNTLYINVAIQGGASGTTQPTWPGAASTVTADGTVRWLNQGATTLTRLANWVANRAYALRNRILDSNGNVEIATVAGTSGASAPAWSTTPGVTTTDNTVTWVNAGALPSAALSATGGTSGFIMDNTVGSGTLAGASQVYFSTLGNQVCGTSGTGGCAVQASQPALR
jgi:hypothetical protein